MKKIMKKIFLSVVVIVMIFAMCTTAFADSVMLERTSLPSGSKSYSAGTCKSGFTTSNYLTKPSSGWASLIKVATRYVKWDGYEDIDNYEYVKPKDQNGNYLKSTWGKVYCGSETMYSYSMLTMTASSSVSKVYLRIENPGPHGQTNYNTGAVIKNMAVSGGFWV